MNANRLLLVGFELANAGLELVNSLEQQLQCLFVDGRDVGGLLCAQTGHSKSQPTG